MGDRLTDWDRAVALLYRANSAQQRLLEGAHDQRSADLPEQARRLADALAGLTDLATTMRETNELDRGR